MTKLGNLEHRRVQRKVAREYRKLGFKVLETPGGTDLPTFLSGFSPDLIATNNNEQVIVEIRRADELKGSNQLTEMAARVAEHPTWRFELIALEAPHGAASTVSPSADLGPLFKTALQHFESGNDALRQTLLISMVSILEAVLHQVALERGIAANNRSMEALIRELSFQAIIDDATATGLERARTLRNSVLHGRDIGTTLRPEATELLADSLHGLQGSLVQFWNAGSADRREVMVSDAAISEVPETRPAVYIVQSASGRVTYIGAAPAGNVRQRIQEHTSPRFRRTSGDKLTILLFDSEDEARRAETLAIEEFSPTHSQLSRDQELTLRQA